MKLSIIIPVLNEREQLPQTLQFIKTHLEQAEIIVVDGGSSDGTREWLETQSGIKVIQAERGRGLQQNAGARIASGDTLLFLHGDCQPSQKTISLIEKALTYQRVTSGAFTIRFAEQQPVSLRLIACGINARTRITRTATGDQGIFVSREIFDSIGGFESWPFFEDVRLVSQLKKRGKFVVLTEPVTISGRRYINNGPWRTTFLMYALRFGYWIGIHPKLLFRWFQDVRPHLLEAKQ